METFNAVMMALILIVLMGLLMAPLILSIYLIISQCINAII